MAKEVGNPYGETERERAFYKKGVDAGKEHQNPSPATLGLIQKMENKIDKVEEKVNEALIGIAKLPEVLSDKFKCDFAGKWVENDVRKIVDKQEKRSYEWMKLAAMTLVGFLSSYILMKLK